MHEYCHHGSLGYKHASWDFSWKHLSWAGTGEEGTWALTGPPVAWGHSWVAFSLLSELSSWKQSQWPNPRERMLTTRTSGLSCQLLLENTSRCVRLCFARGWIEFEEQNWAERAVKSSLRRWVYSHRCWVARGFSSRQYLLVYNLPGPSPRVLATNERTPLLHYGTGNHSTLICTPLSWGRPFWGLFFRGLTPYCLPLD